MAEVVLYDDNFITKLQMSSYEFKRVHTTEARHPLLSFQYTLLTKQHIWINART